MIMLFFTHVWTGYLVYILIVTLMGQFQFSIISLIITLLGSIFPDIDHRKSKIAKKIPIIPTILQFIFGHRGIIHSGIIAIGLGILYLCINQILEMKVTLLLWFIIGYTSHLLADALTPQGIEFFPKILRIHGYIKTGSFAEKTILFLIMVSSTILTLSYFLN